MSNKSRSGTPSRLATLTLVIGDRVRCPRSTKLNIATDTPVKSDISARVRPSRWRQRRIFVKRSKLAPLSPV